jgi:hypothetical protein
VARYTADAVGLLVYLVDALPQRADRLFAEAEAGEAVIQARSTALAETLYTISRDKDVRGITLTGAPEEARHALVDNGPVSLAPVGNEEFREFTRLVESFSTHDGLVVTSHRGHRTDAVITTDGVLRDAGIATAWL